MDRLTPQEEQLLDPDELTEYDAMTPDDRELYAKAFRRGRRGHANPERYARERSQLAVKIARRDDITDFDLALARADKELGGPPA